MTAVGNTTATRAADEDNTDRRTGISPLVWLTGVAVLSGVGLAIAYRGGLGVGFGDPIVYISMAKSFAASHGASVAYGDVYTPSQLTVGGPVSHWPPGYSLLLSLDTHSILTWARVLAVVFFSANVFLFGFLAHRVGVPRFGSVALAVIFAGLSFQLHGTVESEPLFFLLVIVGLHALVSFYERHTPVAVLLMAVAFGLSTVTRFLGEAFVIGGALAIVLFFKLPALRRIGLGAVVLVVGNVPFAIWYAGVHNSPESPAVHLPHSYDIKTTLFTLAGFVVPGSQSTLMRIGVVAAMVVVVVAVMAMVAGGGALSPIRLQHTDWTFLLLTGSYLVFLFFSRSFVDPLIQLNSRMLFLPFMLFLLWCAQNWPRFASWAAKPRSSWAPPLASLLVCLLVTNAVWIAVDAARGAQVGNLATNSPANTALRRAVAAIPPSTLLYSDRPDGVWFVSGRAVRLLPTTHNASTLKKNPRFDAEMSSLRADLCGHPATVAYALSNGDLQPSLGVVEHYLKVATVTSIPGWRFLALDTSGSCQPS